MHSQEEAKLDAMQRVWQSRRGQSSSTSFFEEVNETEDMINLPLQNAYVESQRSTCVAPVKHLSCDDNDAEFLECQDPKVISAPKVLEVPSAKQALKLDASTIGDLPALYTVCALEPHQLPVVGVYVDRRIVPGFKYRVRPLPEVGGRSSSNKCLFDDKALTLQSIGRGYARRFTFAPDNNHLNDNQNYFWSDNRPEGYAFELELLSEGDKFTFFGVNKEPQGTVEILTIEVWKWLLAGFDVMIWRLAKHPEEILIENYVREMKQSRLFHKTQFGG